MIKKAILLILFACACACAHGQTLQNVNTLRLTDAKMIIGGSDNRGKAVTMSGDVTIDNMGVTTISGMSWGGITGKPTTISGYGITDFNSLGDARWSLLAGSTSISTLGTITTGTWNATTIGTSKGGTGLTSFGGTNTLLYTSSASTLTSLTTANSSVLTTSSGGVPEWTAQGTAFNAAFGTGTSNIPQIGSTLGNSNLVYTNSSGQLITASYPSYTIPIGTSEGTPAANTNYYFGWPVAAPLSTTADAKKIYITRTGTIKKIYVTCWIRGTLATASQTITMAINYDNGSYTTIASSDLSARSTLFSNTGLNIAVTAGHYCEIKLTTPNPWTTPCTNLNITGTIEVEYNN